MALTPEQNAIVWNATLERDDCRTQTAAAAQAFLAALAPLVERTYRHWTGPRGASPEAAYREAKGWIGRLTGELDSALIDHLTEIVLMDRDFTGEGL